ncbi:MAG: EAL domain-containing protein [Beijerinckiaceae bacterium]
MATPPGGGWRPTPAAVFGNLEAFRSAGIRLALDNFGKASAPMSILRSVRFDHLKIDRSLIANVESNEACRAIVHAMIDLGESMKMDVTAEGVETIPQLEALRSMRCARVQGYLLGAPMVAARIPEFVRRLREAQIPRDESYTVIEEPDPFGPSGQPR